VIRLLVICCTIATLARANPSPKPAPSLDFDLFGARPKADAARLKELDDKVKTRRAMLKWHQGLGFATLGVLAATLVIGQLHYVDRYAGGDDTGNYRAAHLGLGVSSTLLFATTGALALFAPNPYPKPIKADAALLHKISMGLATAGMVAQLILGPVAGSREGKLDQRGVALAHLVTGYSTFAFMATGVFAYVF
jgi:hypothetical protein